MKVSNCRRSNQHVLWDVLGTCWPVRSRKNQVLMISGEELSFLLQFGGSAMLWIVSQIQSLLKCSMPALILLAHVDRAQALSNALCSHAGLRELSLGSNGFGDHGAQAKLRLQTADLPLAQATAERKPKKPKHTSQGMASF